MHKYTQYRVCNILKYKSMGNNKYTNDVYHGSSIPIDWATHPKKEHIIPNWISIFYILNKYHHQLGNVTPFHGYPFYIRENHNQTKPFLLCWCPVITAKDIDEFDTKRAGVINYFT